MFQILTEAAPRRRKTNWTSVTIVVIALMIASVIGGFAYIAHQQQQLEAVRETSREMRKARQALMETDTAVLNAVIHSDEQASLLAYAQALNKLDTHPAGHFPATVQMDGRAVPAMEMVRSLKTTWAAMIAQTSFGDTAAARQTYVERQAQPLMTRLVQTQVTRLEQLDADYSNLQHRIDFAIILVMTLQIITGAACIGAFVVASRRGSREAAAKTRAIVAATTSREQVMRLFEMTDTLQSASDQNDANAVLRSTAAELIPDFGGALYVFNNSRDRLVLSTAWGSEEAALVDAITIDDCWALKRGKSHVNHPGADRLCCDHALCKGSTLEIPMAARGEILGLLQVHAEGPDAEARLAEVTQLATALADAMSLALANLALRDRLRSQALRDPLTGLYNRRYMEDTLERVVRLAERERQEVAVMMIDLDHFKRLNDQYGHAKGDSVLRDAAAAITAQLRDSDVACRYGGEELMVVMPNCGLEDAAAKAEGIRASIAALTEPGGAQVSASIGVAAIPSTSGAMKDLLGASDAALYEAKGGGRNRVVCAPLQKARAGRRAARPVQTQVVAA
ncbi:diguanylate cyclase [Brevundimonas sp. NPDC092305]|uniref:sensor domain-containing diguanylate cyclase n=1 Tax=Brevundimonas sp. NPDC092305 TaxID=3363957 RepID=UPI0037FD518D